MATKVIIRHKPANPLIGRRELSPADFKSIGIFTQKTQLVFDQERNWWLDADAAKVSAEALQWFEDSTEFTVERQEVDDEEDSETLRHQEAYAASLGSAPQTATTAARAALGESKSESSTTSATSTTTQSTAKAKA
jgi:hypothetical protein